MPDLQPTVVSQPTDLVALVGSSVRFKVVANGHAYPLTYQWLQDGKAIVAGTTGFSGTSTKTLTVSPVSAAMVGGRQNSTVFRCNITNFFGTVYSDMALMVVTTDPAQVTPGNGGTPFQTPGAGGAIFGPTGGPSIVPVGVVPGLGGGVAGAGGGSWQGPQRVAAAGNAHRWHRDGNLTIAKPCGPPLFELPFQEYGDRTTQIWRQRFRQALENFAPLPEYSAHPDRPGSWLIKETTPEHVGAGIGIWERWYCPVPQVHYEFETFPYSFQYVASSSSLASFTKSVTSRITYEYFLERDAAAFPILREDKFYVLPTTTLNSSAQGGGVTLFRTGTGNLHVAPGTAFYVSSDPWIVAEPSKITDWNYPIKCRATRSVPGPTLADLGTVVT